LRGYFHRSPIDLDAGNVVDVDEFIDESSRASCAYPVRASRSAGALRNGELDRIVLHRMASLSTANVRTLRSRSERITP
jgi:hypothetical protein